MSLFNEMNKEEKQNVVLAVFAVVILVYSLYGFVYEPVVQDISRLEKELVSVKKQKSELEIIEQQKGSIQEQYTDRIAKYKRYSQYFVPKSNEVLWSKKVFQEIFDKNGIPIDKIDLACRKVAKTSKKSKKKSMFVSYSFTMKLLKRYHEFGSLLEDLEKAVPFMIVDSVSIMRKDSVPGEKDGELDIELSCRLPQLTEDALKQFSGEIEKL